jgi:3-hydroxybutyryl-CoA dehydrogenase
MIVVITDELSIKELEAHPFAAGTEVRYSDQVEAIDGADVYIDLLFQNTTDRISKLKQLQSSLIVINAVLDDEKELPENFIRINGWPTFLKRPIIEASAADETLRSLADKLFYQLGRTVEWVPGVAGFISPRVISMIINEAYFTLNEKVSTKEEIDTAMKLGTNYPLGPFEWSEKIGLKNIYDLLIKLSVSNTRYSPSSLLKIEALKE